MSDQMVITFLKGKKTTKKTPTAIMIYKKEKGIQ